MQPIDAAIQAYGPPNVAAPMPPSPQAAAAAPLPAALLLDRRLIIVELAPAVQAAPARMRPTPEGAETIPITHPVPVTIQSAFRAANLPTPLPMLPTWQP
jgi:hypothetical protein